MKTTAKRLLIRPSDLAPSHDCLEVVGAFNPGAVAFGGGVLLLVRVAERPRERREGFTALPRWADGRVVVDWVPNEELRPLDPRVVQRKADGLVRLTFTSHLRVLYSPDGRTVESFDGPVFKPASECEEFGVEDPRIARLDERYYFTYVAVSRHGAATALASTRDFRTFERHGVIFHPENKDVVLFPEKIGGEYVALHRPNAATPFCAPEMWIARSSDLIHWGRHEPFLGGLGTWDTGRIGAGTPPIRTPKGWLEIYHGNRRPERDQEVGAYAAGALLLDLEDPRQMLWFSPDPIMEPEQDYEREGFVPDVVFPTGIVRRQGAFLVYYGAADCRTAVAEISDLNLGA